MVRLHHQMGRLLGGHHVCSRKAACTQVVLHLRQLCTAPWLRRLQAALPHMLQWAGTVQGKRWCRPRLT